DGNNSKIAKNPDISGMRSDTTMIAHIAADRSSAVLVSIPRDTLVDIPECKMSNGKTSQAAGRTKFNAAFAYGAIAGDNLGDAAACVQQTVEQVTQVRIDGWVVVDFAGFTDMVNALGGVRMCIDKPMRAPDAKLDIDAGCQKFYGKTALAFARARYNVGDGSDLQRIERQQQLMSAILQKAVKINLLTDLPKLYQFAQAGLASLTTSKTLDSVSSLAGLAFSMRRIPLSKISFVMAPVVDAGDGANVLLRSDAQDFFDSLAEDRKLVGVTPRPALGTPTATPKAP
ncbi:MAG: LCP family protein, partial [Bifidobacteriaceae bacterium]|nr:LCP family protein [Bifidobacteriaceae bacterium]